MAWGDLAKVSKLLESLSQMSDTGGWKIKGNGKGNGKGDAGKGNAHGKGTTRTCAWQDCRAAREQKPTLGGATQCHCCHRKWGQMPPIEKMTTQAYNALLKTKGKPDGSKEAKGGKGGGKGKGKEGKGQAQPSPQQLTRRVGPRQSRHPSSWQR